MRVNIDSQYSTSLRRCLRLGVVLVGAAMAVYGLLFQQMWMHSLGFDKYAFEYWAPKALGVVVVTTILGILVVNRSWKIRAAFGAIAGLTVSFLYIWIF